MRNLLFYFVAIFMVTLSCSPSCDQTYPVGMDLDYMDKENRSMDGLDVVSFYANNKSAQGLDTLMSKNNGVNFLFSSPANKNLFDSNPEQYMPSIGGYCVVAAAFGKVEATDLKHYGVYNGKLYFLTNQKAFDMWMKDQENLTNQGEAMWPCLVADNGRKI